MLLSMLSMSVFRTIVVAYTILVAGVSAKVAIEVEHYFTRQAQNASYEECRESGHDANECMAASISEVF